MKRHYGEARDSGYAVVPLHVLTENQSGGGRRLKFWPRKRLWLTFDQRLFVGCLVTFSMRRSCQRVEMVAMVPTKHGLAFDQGGRKRKKSSFVERSKGKRAFGQGVSNLNRRCWAWNGAARVG